ncbi:hypothetical protein F383_36091 [Gossypium arboreum]|uniref:Uncharacterized protein n=1 Tax=Gossypium arboreum TaxID=29729 RepID=A0A0B0N854_GOSAR|nr:hypothetical protein F383_36091 [Gossypium arboreum]
MCIFSHVIWLNYG